MVSLSLSTLYLHCLHHRFHNLWGTHRVFSYVRQRNPFYYLYFEEGSSFSSKNSQTSSLTWSGNQSLERMLPSRAQPQTTPYTAFSNANKAMERFQKTIWCPSSQILHRILVSKSEWRLCTVVSWTISKIAARRLNNNYKRRNILYNTPIPSISLIFQV